MNVVLWIFAVLPALCHAHFFPQENVSKVTKEAFCEPPLHIPENDTYEYTQYTRLPFTGSSALDWALHLAPEDKQQLHKELLERIYAHPLLMTRNQIAKSMSSPGDDARIQAFVNKLLSGQPVTVVLLGGSITAGHGTKTRANGYGEMLFTWIRTTFPHPDHQFLNHATPATTSSYISPCVLTMVPDNADLVLLEFTINDTADERQRLKLEHKRKHNVQHEDRMDQPSRRAMERLIRELLMVPSSPAIIYLHAWAPTIEQEFYGGVEDYLTTIMTYYGVTALSFRNAMFRLVKQEPELSHRIWITQQEFHPSCAGTRFMSDMIIGFLMEQAAAAAWIRHATELQTLTGHPGQLLPPSEPSRELPPPLFKDNWGSYTTQCILDDKIEGYIALNEGFSWTSEGQSWDPKWGYVSHTPNSQIRFKVPLSSVQHNGEDLVLGLGMLLSWSGGMGVARIGCVQGCACEPRQFSTQIAHSGYSMTYWEFLKAKVVPGAEECIVEVVNVEHTYSTGHKVKICSLLVSGELGTLVAGNAWLEMGTVGTDGVDTSPADVAGTR